VGTAVTVRAAASSRRQARFRSTRRRAPAAGEDAGRLLDDCARRCRELLDRSAPFHLGLPTAGAVDLEAATLVARLEQERLLGQSHVARTLAERGALAEGVTEAEARDVMFTMMSARVHRVLTMQRGWSAHRYEGWLARSLRALLLPHAVEPPRRRRR